MAVNKQDLSLIKEIIENENSYSIRATIAEKPGWLLLKTTNQLKTFGCVRLNKNSFVTLYIDTKEGVLLSEELGKLEHFKNIDIKSRPTGNFVQNKIKLISENQIDLIMEAIDYVFNKDIVKTGKRVRNTSTNFIVA